MKLFVDVVVVVLPLWTNRKSRERTVLCEIGNICSPCPGESGYYMSPSILPAVTKWTQTWQITALTNGSLNLDPSVRYWNFLTVSFFTTKKKKKHCWIISLNFILRLKEKKTEIIIKACQEDYVMLLLIFILSCVYSLFSFIGLSIHTQGRIYITKYPLYFSYESPDGCLEK